MLFRTNRLFLAFLVFSVTCLLSFSFRLFLNRPALVPWTTNTVKIQQQPLWMSADSESMVEGGDEDEDEYEEKPKPFKGFSKKREEEITKEVKKTKEEILADQRLESQIRSTKMFEKKRAREEAELDAKIAAVREEEELIASDPSVGAVPEVSGPHLVHP